MNLLSLSAGRYFKLGRNSWATTEAGLSYVDGEKASFKPTPVYTTSIFFAETTSSNYETTIEKNTAVGAIARADLNWAFASFMGLGAGVYAHINSIQSPFGFQLKMIIGAMGRKKKERN